MYTTSNNVPIHILLFVSNIIQLYITFYNVFIDIIFFFDETFRAMELCILRSLTMKIVRTQK